jgi:hypothetical protein
MASPKVTNAQARTSALLLLGAGAFFVKFGYFDVLREAQKHAEAVAASNNPIFVAPVFLATTKVLIFAPAFLVIGLVLLVTGAPSETGVIGRLLSRPEDGEIAPLGIALLLATLFPGIALYLWLEHRLALLGFV